MRKMLRIKCNMNGSIQNVLLLFVPPHHSAVQKETPWGLVIKHFKFVLKIFGIIDIKGELVKILKGKREHLVPIQIGNAGQLQECIYGIDLTSPQRKHRLVSHLYGLFPGSQIKRCETFELFDAARKSLGLRGDGGTERSKAWKRDF
ncbi:MAG: hypothetical protein WCZ89_03770 [Phycisphaerae bacterium]